MVFEQLISSFVRSLVFNNNDCDTTVCNWYSSTYSQLFLILFWSKTCSGVPIILQPWHLLLTPLEIGRGVPNPEDIGKEYIHTDQVFYMGLKWQGIDYNSWNTSYFKSLPNLECISSTFRSSDNHASPKKSRTMIITNTVTIVPTSKIPKSILRNWISILFLKITCNKFVQGCVECVSFSQSLLK